MTHAAIPLTLNLNGTLRSLHTPLVMGILNATPDSFFAQSRCVSEREIAQAVERILREGGDIIDLGAYSSRPNATHITPEEEWERLQFALNIIQREAPQAVVSVDTFRATIARRSVEEYGVAIINDISGGELDEAMFSTVAQLNVPYILMHMRGTPQTMQQNTHYDNLMGEILHYFSQKLETLSLLGVNDVILDPGFGFSKTLEDNYRLMGEMQQLSIFGLPILSGISRKSMIYRLLDTTPEESLNGTTILNTLSLLGGASLLRVHDVKEAVECVQIVTALRANSSHESQSLAL